MENVVANALGERVSLLTCALAEAPRPARFDYGAWRTGSSRSQLADSADHSETSTTAPSRLSELKLAQTVDALIAEEAIRSPQAVKIDVDGTELSILQGMRAMLTGPSRPRTLQVECMPDNAREIETLLAGCGYTLRQRHATMAGAKRLATGAEVAGIVHNAVFSAA
jgi:FkbM family methyltransferase